MIEIKSVKWRNFLAYGDYDTEVPGLDSLGPVLIIGETDNGGSNGAGKSTITNAILWCLFGKTFNKDKPGDNVVNWFVGERCLVEIITVDGWTIRRTRKMDGHDDLVVYNASGADETRSTNTDAQKFLIRQFNLDYTLFVSSTFFGQISKSYLELPDQARKAALERLLGLDRINSWADVAKERYKSVEDRQEVLRSKLELCKNDVNKFNTLIEQTRDKENNFNRLVAEEIIKFDQSIAEVSARIDDFNNNVQPRIDNSLALIEKLKKVRESRAKIVDKLSNLRLERKHLVNLIDTLNNNINIYVKRKEKYKLFDYDKVVGEHNKYQEYRSALSKIDTQINSVLVEIKSVESDIAKARVVIERWEKQAGKKCPSCQQDIDKSHTENICAPYTKQLDDGIAKLGELKANLAGLNARRSSGVVGEPAMSLVEASRVRNDLLSVDNDISDSNAKVSEYNANLAGVDASIAESEAMLQKVDGVLASRVPEFDESDINSLVLSNRGDLSRLQQLNTDRLSKLGQENPYTVVLAEFNDSLVVAVDNVRLVEKDIDEQVVVGRHYYYLWRAYSDRRKIKSFVLANLIPYLNQRVQYYLDSFNCDIGIKFNDSLGVDSNLWGYEFSSGGERKRIDLSIMFALFDLYLSIHGRQCNVMILDEVDGRLDSVGIDSFIKIITNDFCGSSGDISRPGTVMVISHRNEMLDAFPAKIQVKRDENRFSHIVNVV